MQEDLNWALISHFYLFLGLFFLLSDNWSVPFQECVKKMNVQLVDTGMKHNADLVCSAAAIHVQCQETERAFKRFSSSGAEFAYLLREMISSHENMNSSMKDSSRSRGSTTLSCMNTQVRWKDNKKNLNTETTGNDKRGRLQTMQIQYQTETEVKLKTKMRD